MLALLCLVVVLRAVAARELSDEEYYQLPPLFHLDDYQKCFSQDDGLYCLGAFHLTPLGEPNVVYDLLKEYASENYTFNRTLIHRGYCVSSRCPDLNTTQPALRFEHCAAREASEKLLQPNLTTLHYCRTTAEAQGNEAPDLSKLVFLIVACGLLLLNITGTVYDVTSKNKEKKIEVLMVWSVRSNWKQLTRSHKTAVSSPLAALHGIRVGITVCVCLTHSALLYFMMYSYKPRVLEQALTHPLSMIIQNSTSAEQMMFAISGFLLALQMQYLSEKYPVSFGMLVLVISKRIFRLFPVFILVVGFAATWWPAMSDGPLWSAYVGGESNICRQKFWTHLLFVNNLVEPEKMCILSTWYMAVDIQLHIISTVILVVLMRLPIPKIPVLVVLFIGSILINASLTYSFDWSPMLYLTVSSENLRTLFHNQPSFAGLYISPWGNLPACLLGLILGHLYYRMRDVDALNADWIVRFRWLLKLTCFISAPLLLGWILLGYFFQHITNRAFVVAYAAIERSLFQIACLLSYVVLSIVSGILIKFLAWRGWHAMSRMSYPVMLVHWVVNLYIVASTPQPLSTSIMDIGIHGFITAFYTFLLAIPITILVEMPMKKVFDIIIS